MHFGVFKIIGISQAVSWDSCGEKSSSEPTVDYDVDTTNSDIY